MRFAVNPFFLLYFSSNFSSKFYYRLQDHLLGLSDLRTTSRSSNNDYHPVFNAWKASRRTAGRDASLITPGTQRPLSLANARLALFICQECAMDFIGAIWALNPVRTTAMLLVNIIRSLFPAFRGYSQALIVDELQTLIASGTFTWTRLLYLSFGELVRRFFEGLLEHFATKNETIVTESARFFVEYQQLEKRIRLDVPTLADPDVRDLLQESELFTRSFNGGGFGLLSPLDFVHVFALLTEIASHLFLIYSLTSSTTHVGILMFSVISAMLPYLLAWCHNPHDLGDSQYSRREIRAADRQERMRNLAYSEAHRPEISLFGLGDWILKSWSRARSIVLESERLRQTSDFSLFLNTNFSDLVIVLQNVPYAILLRSPAASLGSLTLYRTSVQSLVYALRSLLATTRMAFQGIFLMSAFSAAMKLKPILQPKEDEIVKYKTAQGGASIHVKELSFTYPGCAEPALRNVSLDLEPGESLAIVGHNGSGKSTLAKILLRVIDFDKGTLMVNGVDIRRYNPDDYHHHLTAVFQGFSKFNFTIQKNVGLGNVDKINHRPTIEQAMRLAEANAMVDSLPSGLETKLQTPGFESIPYPGNNVTLSHLHGLSGGEWQRIAIARAFMRASEPDVDLMIFDEPTSSLDPHAQNSIFDNIDKLSKSLDGERIKTVIYITHRLPTARRADKIAMMENGTITEFGTHQELMRKDAAYANLYRASLC
jgi:ABC-type multidrug transport system fused ATPase/permease subunit